MDFKLRQTVYHRDVYDFKEPLTIVGIRETELELEGDYSGGTHTVIQKSWLPISGVSKVYDFDFKAKARKSALLMVSEDYNVTELVNYILKLTEEIKEI